MKTSFWTYFTSGYGMIWMFFLGAALIAQKHLDAGLFGLFGFPVIAVIYAWIRCSKDSVAESGQVQHVLPPRMAEFLTAHPEFLNAPPRLRNSAFHNWLNNSDML